MSIVNRVPRGLLAYLDSQTQGENPSNLSEVVAPVLSMEPFYRANARYELFSVGNFVMDAPNDHVGFTVPAGEIWHVHSASGTIHNLTGGLLSMRVSLTVQNPGMLSTDYLALAGLNILNLPDTAMQRMPSYPGLVVLLSGQRIQMQVDQITAFGPGTNGYFAILVNRMQA
jgi:hypothetical protein